MSSLSGYDSEAVGFESVSQRARQGSSTGTQTSEFGESGVGSQTNLYKECGSMVCPSDLNAEDEVLKEYPPPGLNAFLRKVVPGMLEQLDQNEREGLYNSSDSEEEEALQAKLLQEIDTCADKPGLGGGDHQSASILSVSWSGAGRSLAAGVGQSQHARWCEHEGLVRVYSAARAPEDQLAHAQDIADSNCVTVVLYHPSVAGLLAYGTSAGSVAAVSLRGGAPARLAAPEHAHGARAVTALAWPDPALANVFLTMQIQNTGKRRGASDQILVSSGADGCMCVWQLNTSLRIFELVVRYAPHQARRLPALDISCFDFIKSYPLRPSDEKVPDDVFVVGTNTGSLVLCGVRGAAPCEGGLDPARAALGAHAACVLRVAFSAQRAGVLASLAADAELRLYHVDQPAPLKVFCLDEPASCMSWLPHNPCAVVLGMAGGKQPVRLFDVSSGRLVPVEGLSGTGGATAIAVDQSGSCRVACGDSSGALRVWELPARRARMAPGGLHF